MTNKVIKNTATFYQTSDGIKHDAWEAARKAQVILNRLQREKLKKIKAEDAARKKEELNKKQKEESIETYHTLDASGISMLVVSKALAEEVGLSYFKGTAKDNIGYDLKAKPNDKEPKIENMQTGTYNLTYIKKILKIIEDIKQKTNTGKDGYITISLKKGEPIIIETEIYIRDREGNEKRQVLRYYLAAYMES